MATASLRPSNHSNLPRSEKFPHKIFDMTNLSLPGLSKSKYDRMKEQVTQGQYVVTDTRCPALSDCESEGGEAGQRPRRGQSPVEHRGTFVRPSILLSIRHPQAHTGLKSFLSGLESVRADFRPERTDFRPERADFRPERAWGDGRTD